MTLLGGGETVTVVAVETGFDEDGNPVKRDAGVEIHGCVVEPVGQATIDDRDIVSGDTTSLRVLAPGGTVVDEGAQVKFRGESYVVKFAPFDYAPGRRPVLARHRPRVVFVIERMRT